MVSRAAYRVRITGRVQGVGFRPFVHRLAIRHELSGWVKNTTADVQIAIEGTPNEVEAFLGELRSEAPPMARIVNLTLEPAGPEGRSCFAILPSDTEAQGDIPVPADTGICAACLAELLDPGNRRYRYPFITCTDCGPRYTVIEAMPYDRERTSMAVFRQCPACLGEYFDPASRRYHCESNGCPKCGPRLWFENLPRVEAAGPEAALDAAVGLLREGGILGVRGLGGFHLAVDAADEAAVARLRERKHRDAKPFAVMVRSLEEARQLADLEPAEEECLLSPERPVVLALRREGAPLAPSVAPGLSRIGLLLAYTPLHHLLLEAEGRPLVMTSGNRSDEPIATGNQEARDRLAGIADGFLFHDRDIVNRYDDSVLRVASGRPVMIRRARGYAPAPIPLPIATPVPLLAVGPLLKNTFTLATGSSAWVSQHIGDLETFETLEHFERSLDRYRSLFRIDPEVAVRDTHPEYLSSRVAEQLGLPRVMEVQHHHAHIAAVMAEHGVTGPVIGLALDGAGYGDDGTVWGAEVLVGDLTGYRRAAHLLPVPLPGGDRAARSPWRAAAGYLSVEPGFRDSFGGAFQSVNRAERELVERQLAEDLNAPLASSMGRLFDAAAAILGVRHESSFEGQAAMELEALAGFRPATEYPSRFIERDGRVVLDPLPLLAVLGTRRRRGEPVADLAADFHASIAWALAALIRRVAADTGLSIVALGGGVFQNGRLLTSMVKRLERDGLRVLVPGQLPPNDGCISYGQAAVAAARISSESGLETKEQQPCA
jgi:hydrogenase maturation protein HypF